ncbi:flavin reductase family protein [Caulobacter mirabilis]|uniref:Flavin oxidoreductase n=1 Tax=Caulobacter mirabilis TaxID=69666 RepID=A0A2D2B0V3_9CAUL|nr:flavin reductase family protein [Caulobacter mirabilis]ATQ43837.1 flavin oxidoreductase [Caulobacter mirabilis]
MDAVHTFELGQDPETDARALRNAFGCFTTGVTVVTTLDGDRRVGFTANSFTSISLDPPLALVSIGLGASCLPALAQSGRFVVNVLHVDQQDVARQFARRDCDRFDGVGIETWLTGVPVLNGCMANFECETHHAFQAGDHQVFVGRILKVRYDPSHEPLVFLRGGYRRVHTDAPTDEVGQATSAGGRAL